MSTFQEYQTMASKVPVSLRNSRDRISLPVSGLQQEAGNVGALFTTALSTGKLNLTPEQSGEIRERMADILWYLATLCQEAGISLQEVAECSVAQLQARARALDPEQR